MKDKFLKSCSNLDEFQTKYYPSKVGKDCPYCSKPFDYDKCIHWIRDKIYFRFKEIKDKK
ncbi:hypothetical protein LCGC14_1666670 [marine sediment metagenome]|uniref:Uncharacterized protein n=1 Tax=marine sediment metagenome TaxID=412755 RepID=A0A0F9K8B0_9ZZZZ